MATRDLTKRFVEQRAEIKLKKPRPTHRPNDSSISSSVNGPIPGDVHLLGNPKDLEKGGTDWKAARSQLPPQWVDVVDRLKVRRNLQKSLAFKIQRLSNSFRSQQKEYLNKLRAQKEGALGGGQFAFLEKKEGVGEGEVMMVPDANSETGFSQAQVAAMENMDVIVNERDTEITRIAESIEELAHVMKHLAELVIDQGTVLDRIDYNMDMAVEHVTQGIVQLEETEKIQKQGGPVKCIFALIFLIFVLLVVQVLKHAPRRRR